MSTHSNCTFLQIDRIQESKESVSYLQMRVGFILTADTHYFRQRRVVVIVINILRFASCFLQVHPWSQSVLRRLRPAGDGDLADGSGRSVRGACVSVQVLVFTCVFRPAAAQIERHLFVQVPQFAVFGERAIRQVTIWNQVRALGHGRRREFGPDGERLDFPPNALRHG